MVQRVFAIVVNTFREAVRDRVLYGVLGMGVAAVLFALALAELSLHEERRVVRDLGLGSVSFFSVVMTVFLGASLLYKEIDKKTLYIVLPKPLRRSEFLVGKFFGVVLCGVVFVLLMGTVQFLTMAIQQGSGWMLPAALLLLGGGVFGALGMWAPTLQTALVMPWSLMMFGASALLAYTRHAEVFQVGCALVLSLGEVMLLAAVTMFFSSFSSPFLTGMFAVGVWVMGRSADDMARMKTHAIGPGVQRLLHGLAEVIPNFNLYVPGVHFFDSETLAGRGELLVYVGQSVGYAALYAALLMAFAAMIFQRRDFI